MKKKRKSSYVRFGRSDPELAQEKRKSSYVRFGRSGLDMDIDGAALSSLAQKRKSSYVRFGRSDPDNGQSGTREEKEVCDIDYISNLLARAQYNQYMLQDTYL